MKGYPRSGCYRYCYGAPGTHTQRELRGLESCSGQYPGSRQVDLWPVDALITNAYLMIQAVR